MVSSFKTVLASGVTAITLIIFYGISFYLAADPLRPGVAITPRFHIGIYKGAIIGYSDVAFRGGTWNIGRAGEPSLVQERAITFPGGYLVILHASMGTFWSLEVPLIYLILMSAVLPLVWLCRTHQPGAINKNVEPTKGMRSVLRVFRLWRVRRTRC